MELTDPLHPIVFNDLFCLRDERVHTLSVGAARPQDLDLHLEAVSRLDDAQALVSSIEARLHQAELTILGDDWLSTWRQGLPSWQTTPGEINLPVLLWLHNLVEAWGLEGYARARYGLLGRAGHWFPGANADALDRDVGEDELDRVLLDSPWRSLIPEKLRRLRERVGGGTQERLSSA